MERSGNIHRLDLPSTEKMVFAAKVNRVCSLDRTSFNDQTDLPDVQEIINTLDPRLAISSFGVEIHLHDNESSTTQITGQTNRGEMKVTIDEGEKDHRYSVGKEDLIGIGEYIVKKRKSGSKAYVLIFSHFMDNDVNELEIYLRKTPDVGIVYDRESRNPVMVEKLVPVERRLFGFPVVIDTKVPVWKAK